MEVIGLGLGNPTSCPDELITDGKQYYRVLTQSLHCPIILGCFISGKSKAMVTLTYLGICPGDMVLPNTRGPLNKRRLEPSFQPEECKRKI